MSNNNYSKGILILSLLGVFLVNVEYSALNLALTEIAQYFSIHINKTSSILSLYLAFFAVSSVIGGKLGDLWGRKNITLIMLMIFTMASFIGGFSTIYIWILIARSLQGLAAGAILPNLTAILYNNTPIEKKSHAIGLISATVGLATTIGPLIGSLVSNYLGWRYIFFMNIPFSLIIMICIFLYLKEKKEISSFKKLDYKGAFLTIMLILVLMKLIELIPYFKIFEILLFLFIFLVLFYCWLKYHQTHDGAFLSLHLFKQRSYALGCIIRTVLGFSRYSIVYILGMFSLEFLHLKTNLAGSIYIPMALSGMLVSIIYGKLSQKIKRITLLRLGLAIYLIGILLFLYTLNNIPILILALIILGSSYGILYSVLFSITLQEIHSDNTSEASGSLYFFNLLGGTIGVCISGILFALFKQNTLKETLVVGVSYTLLCSALLISLCLILSLLKHHAKSHS